MAKLKLVANYCTVDATQSHADWLRASDGSLKFVELHCPICERCGSCDAPTHFDCLFTCSFCRQGNCEACVQECTACKAKMRCRKCARLGRVCCQSRPGFGPLTFAYALAKSTRICRLYLVARKFKTVAQLGLAGTSVSNVVCNDDHIYMVTDTSQLVSYDLKNERFSVPALAKIVPYVVACSLQLFAGRFIYICTMRNAQLYRYDIITEVLSTLSTLYFPVATSIEFVPTFKFNEQYVCMQYKIQAEGTRTICGFDTLDPEAGWKKLHVGQSAPMTHYGTAVLHQTSNLLISRFCQDYLEYICPYPALACMSSVRPFNIIKPKAPYIYAQYNGVFSGNQLYICTLFMNVYKINLLHLPPAYDYSKVVTADQV